jgi:hypothetical protein
MNWEDSSEEKWKQRLIVYNLEDCEALKQVTEFIYNDCLKAVLVHALGELEMLYLFHIARSFAKTRCPRLLTPPNKALATAPFPSGMVGRFPEARISCSTRKAGLSYG